MITPVIMIHYHIGNRLMTKKRRKKICELKGQHYIKFEIN